METEQQPKRPTPTPWQRFWATAFNKSGALDALLPAALGEHAIMAAIMYAVRSLVRNGMPKDRFLKDLEGAYDLAVEAEARGLMPSASAEVDVLALGHPECDCDACSANRAQAAQAAN